MLRQTGPAGRPNSKLQTTNYKLPNYKLQTTNYTPPVRFFNFILHKEIKMKKINIAIWVTTLGLLLFVILCTLPVSLIFLQLYLFALTGSLIWMVITILKNGEPSRYTFEERFYEDADLGPKND